MTDPLAHSFPHEVTIAKHKGPGLQGTVASLHLAPDAYVPMTTLTSAQFKPGRGMVGDRFYLRRGTDAASDQTSCDVTLIEQEAIAALLQQYPQADLGASARRNIVVRDCSLARLVGRTFRIGDVTLYGLAPRTKGEPISPTPENTVRQTFRTKRGQQAAGCGILPPQIHLRAAVLTEGTIRIGDHIILAPEECS
jgi:hypothetical protein